LVPSVGRAVRILNAFTEGTPTMSLASLSKQLELPRSSTLALCNTLVEAGLLAQGDDGAYRLGPHVLELSRAYLAQTNLHREFDRVCRESDVLHEQTLVLSVLDGTDVVYIGRRQGSRPVGVSYELGMSLPANCTASGKVLLCSLSPQELRDLYGATAGTKLPALSAQSITDLDALIDDLAVAARDGYAIDDEETAPGMMCVGAPVTDGSSRPIGAVAVSMVKAALGPDEIQDIAAELGGLAAEISTSLGGTASA
jgi:DNA-binding IclR family transcriptional regulator